MAAILSGSWRDPVDPWSGSPGELAALAPLLLHGGVAGLAWRRVQRSVGDLGPAAAEMQQAYRLQVLRAVLHEQAVGRSFALLRARGIEPLLGKGWAAARLYPDPGLRPYGDIDLYVRADQYDAAREAVATPDADCPIDLHAGLAELDDRAPAQVNAASVRADADDVAARLFGPADHLRLLCLHAMRHGLLRPIWLCDIAAAVERRPADFDWDRFAFGDVRRTRWALAAIGVAQQLLGARLDGTPLADRARRIPRWLVPAVLAEWGSTRPAQGARLPMAAAIRRPRTLLRAIGTRWPNAIEATVAVGASPGAGPRLPYQVAECARRSVRFITAFRGDTGSL